ncbi:MAG TPA: Gp138 family membrane-puncturing spike protein [Xylella sp.]
MSLDDWNNAFILALWSITALPPLPSGCAWPCLEIVHFNPVTQTATVQPCIQQVMSDTSLQPWPVLQDVPVVFPRGGGFVLIFPVALGDEGELICQDCCINGWFQSGRIAEPLDYR